MHKLRKGKENLFGQRALPKVLAPTTASGLNNFRVTTGTRFPIGDFSAMRNKILFWIAALIVMGK